MTLNEICLALLREAEIVVLTTQHDLAAYETIVENAWAVAASKAATAINALVSTGLYWRKETEEILNARDSLRNLSFTLRIPSTGGHIKVVSPLGETWWFENI